MDQKSIMRIDAANAAKSARCLGVHAVVTLASPRRHIESLWQRRAIVGGNIRV
jgi:hypothetical protein